MSADDGRPLVAAGVQVGPDCQLVFDDVVNLGDHEADQPAPVLADDRLDRVCAVLVAVGLQGLVQAHQRENLAAVLDDLVTADPLEAVQRELLEAVHRSQRQRDRRPSERPSTSSAERSTSAAAVDVLSADSEESLTMPACDQELGHDLVYALH